MGAVGELDGGGVEGPHEELAVLLRVILLRCIRRLAHFLSPHLPLHPLFIQSKLGELSERKTKVEAFPIGLIGTME